MKSIRTTRQQLHHLVPLAVLALFSFGCSSVDTSGTSGTSDSSEPVASITEAYSTAACASAKADGTLVGDEGTMTSPHTYNNCGKGFVVDVYNSNASGVAVVWNDTIVNTFAGCNDIELAAKYYERDSGGAWTQIDDDYYVEGGTWLGNFCFPPFLTIPVADSEFRVATTARRLSGGNPTRKHWIQVE